MGGGEFIPNGSMHWTVVEEEVSTDGNGTVHRKKSKRPALQGLDLIDYKHIGKGKDKHSHDGALLVTLQFRSRGEATDALRAAQATIAENPDSKFWRVEIRVPTADQPEAHTKPAYPNPFAQARVEW